jgi:F0F1-type ATP synthase assembly protein I
MVRSWWGRHFLVAEFGLAVAASLMFAAWGTWWGGSTVVSEALDQNRGAFYGTVAAVAGSLLGFAIAALAIAMGALDSRRLTALRASKHVTTLINTFTAATICLGITTVGALICLLADRDATPRPAMFYALLLGIIASGLTLARSVWALHALVQISSGPSKARSGDA